MILHKVVKYISKGTVLDLGLRSECFHVFVPLLASSSLKYSGFIFRSWMIIGLGTLSLAADSLTMSIEELFYIAAYGFQSSISTLVGEAIGRGDNAEYRRVLRNGNILTFSTMVVNAVVLLTLSGAVSGLFTSDAGVASLSGKLLWISAFSFIPVGLQTVWGGVLACFDESRWVAFGRTFALWIVRLVPMFVGLRWFNMSIEVCWWLSVLDIFVCSMLLWWKLRGLNVEDISKV